MSFLKKHREIIIYLIFGVATTFVNWILYILCVKALSLGITAGNAIGWIGAVLFAFITNRRYVFLSKNTAAD